MSGDLARRLVACRLFRWMPGMHGTGMLWMPTPKRTPGKYRGPIDPWEGQPCVIVKRNLRRGTAEAWFFAEPPIPDLGDAATAGCLVDLLLQQSTPDLGVYWEGPLHPEATRWCVEVRIGRTDVPHYGATLGEAAARALIALSEVTDE